jgi:phosphoribosyl 1,2-cyclic phosphodiesterase
MRVRFWGVRGSFPVSDPRVLKVGGNSSCVEIDVPGSPRIILDAGTGLKPLGQALMHEDPRFARGEGEGALLISHTHWDHIQGFMFFEPFYVDGNRFTVYARSAHDGRLRTTFEAQMGRSNFAFGFEALNAELSWRALSEESRFEIGEVKVRTARLNHPGIALGYRLEHDGRSVVYMTDTAPYDDQLLGEGFHIRKPSEDPMVLDLIEEYRDKLVDLCQDADVLIYDTFFTREQYRQNPHWGHSTAERGIALARRAGVSKFFLYHHHPEDHDDQLIARAADFAQRYNDDELSIHLSREGLNLEV